MKAVLPKEGPWKGAVEKRASVVCPESVHLEIRVSGPNRVVVI